MNQLHSFAFSFTLLSSLGLLHSPLAFSAQEERAVPVTDVFAPRGFDTNDVTQIVVSGNLPNLCYKSPKSVVTLENNVINVQVTALYEEVDDVACAQAVIPLLEVIPVGVLAEGTYDVKVNDGTATALNDTIEVAKATSLTVNDHIYARVDRVERVPNSRVVKLHGYNPSDCFDLQEIRYISNEKDTYSVLPIMKKVQEHCPLKMTEFTYEAAVPADLTADELLLHVRVMKGDSVNALFDNRAPTQTR